MSAFNWVVFDGTCPVCQQPSTIEAQVHTAASYGGDATGRFNERRYKLGDRMAWWEPSDPRHEEWRSPNTVVTTDGRVREAAYATCSLCNAEFWALIEFQGLVPIRVDQMGTIADWPTGFPK